MCGTVVHKPRGIARHTRRTTAAAIQASQKAAAQQEAAHIAQFQQQYQSQIRGALGAGQDSSVADQLRGLLRNATSAADANDDDDDDDDDFVPEGDGELDVEEAEGSSGKRSSAGGTSNQAKASLKFTTTTQSHSEYPRVPLELPCLSTP